MRKGRHEAFTLIELLIVISILLLVLTFVYLPYAHYQEKIKIKQVVREASQGISEARNMAINGFDEKLESEDEFNNKSIGLYFDNSDEKKGAMYFFSYPHKISKINIKAEEISRDKISLLKTRQLPTGTQFDSGQAGPTSDLNNMLFFFESITGFGSYYTFSASGNKTTIENVDVIDLDFSYKGSPSIVLKKQLHYDTRVNIVDF